MILAISYTGYKGINPLRLCCAALLIAENKSNQ